MTQTEGNHGSNRRQPQAKVTTQKMSNRHTEAPGEGLEAAASADAKILVRGGSSIEATNCTTMTTNKHQHGGNRRQPEDKLKGKGDIKHPQGGTEAEAGAKSNASTEKPSTGGNSRNNNDTEMTTMVSMDLTQSPEWV
jgi:hypothetical protein